MNAPRPINEEELFARASEVPADKRAAFLAAVCGSDLALRAGVESLLRADAAAGTFMEESPVAELAQAVTQPAQRDAETVAGERIGRYKLLQKIGEGGCGVVYLAEQEQPVRRRVALKVIKLGMDTKQVIARFEAERQALALMDHPNIARVFDAGATATGRPFFVMELVRGVPITKYCDTNQLDLRERLLLFIATCHAIQHAHQKGIIHRDIKPTNILVMLHEGTPMPKVIDFGIAKATQGRLTDQTLFTAFEQFIGTPAYVSPEQAEMSGLEIDTRSDIYSLGVLLYELLTDRTPFESRELLNPGIDEIRRRICEQEPTRPSVRLGGLPDSDQLTIARHRRAEVTKLAMMLRGDLDWIVMRCLEKDRTRRYETAGELAADVQRHLRHEPVVARAPQATYRLRKLVRRNRVAFLSGGAIVASLIVGLAVSAVPVGPAAAIVGSLVAGLTASTVLFLQEQHAKREKDAAVNRALREKAGAEQARAEEARLRLQAEANEQKAQTEAARSAQVAQFLKDMIKDADALVALGYDTKLLRGIVDLMAGRLQTDLGGQPDVAADLREILGSVYLNLQLFETAASMFSEALAVRRRLRGSEHPEVACSLNYLGVVLGRQGKLAEAEAMIRLAAEMQEKLLGPNDPGVAEFLGNLGVVLAQQDRPAEAETAIRGALALHETLLGREHVDVARSLKKLGAVLQFSGNLDEAAGCLREALAINRKLRGNQHPEVASSLQLLAVALVGQGHNYEAEACYREAVAIRQQVPTTAAHSHASLIAALEQQGSLAELDHMLSRTVDYMRARFGRDSAEAAFATAPRVHVLLLEQKFAEAEAPARECLAIRERLIPDDWSTFHVRSMLGAALVGQKKFAEAEPLLLVGYRGLARCEAIKALPAENEMRPREAAERLVRLYTDWGQAEPAAGWAQTLAEIDRSIAEKRAASAGGGTP
jgi:tetratricopeptide (TPR) repeat protein